MNLMAAKFLSRHGSKLLRRSNYELLRLSSSSNNNNSNNTTSTTCTKESCPPPKADVCQEKEKTEKEVPSCSVLPCPPKSSGLVPDPNNPCNYCPPECIDPDYVDLTKLKRNQCRFQKNDGVPLYLKGGKLDVFFYRTTVFITLISVALALYHLHKMAKK